MLTKKIVSAKIFLLLFLSLAVGLSTAVPANADSWWLLNEGTGTVAHDSAGGESPHNGTIYGSPTWNDLSLNFDGINDYINMGDPADGSLDFGASDSFSISLWLKRADSGFFLLGKGNDVLGSHDPGYVWEITANGRCMSVTIRGGANYPSTTIVGNTPLTLGEWYHAVFVRNTATDTIYLYLNGYSDATPVTDETGGGGLQNSYNFTLGNATYYGDYFQGTMNDVRVYRRALTSAEISQIHQDGLAPSAASGPTPSNGATNVNPTVDLSWTGSSRTVYRDVYFGTNQNPFPKVISNGTALSYDPGAMALGTTYYWQVVEKNAHGTATGTLWSFTTTTVPPVPGQPGNPTPSNGATNVSLTQDLSWTAGSGATMRDVYFDTHGQPDNKVISDGTALSYDTGTMALGTKYYWQVIEKNAYGSTAGPVWSFTTTTVPPPLPGQASNPNPSNGATNVSVYQDLGWSPGSGATSRDVYFDIHSQPDNKVISNGTALSYDPGTMAASTTYYWRVDEKNAGGTTTGVVWSFTTAVLPLPPTQAGNPAPSSAATNVSRTQDLGWSPGSGATMRDVYFGTANPPVTKVISDGTALTYDTGTMAANTTYYWRVDEKNIYGTTTGLLWSFTTVPPPPGQPSNPAPTNGATNVSRTQDLSWTAGSGATMRDVYFGTANPPVTKVISNGTALTYDTGTMATSTTYYWRVDEKNAGGTTTGVVWSFTTVPPPPGQPSNPAPTNGATNVSRTQDLGWSPGSGATMRDVYFGTANPPVTKVISNGTALTYDTGTMATSTTYYWRVDEKNAGGTTTGVVWSFTTVPPPPGQPSNPAPTNGATNVSRTQDLSWTAGSGATMRDVYFGTANPPVTKVISNGTALTYDTGIMATSTTYYWRVDEKNAGGTTTGVVWSFTTYLYLDPNLASWWKFDEVSGTVAHDSAGNNDGSLYGEPGPTWNDGALSFDGIDDYVGLSNFIVSTDKGTISLWFETSADYSANYGGMGYLISQDNQWYSYLTVAGDGTGSYWIIGETDSQDDYYVAAEGTAPVGIRNHLVVSFDEKEATTYLNGVLIDTRQVTNSSLTVNRIGGRTDEYFNGEIDNVRIYNRALSAGEVEQLYSYGEIYTAFNPHPADGAIGVDPATVLSWSPGKDADSHDVYFGTTNPPPLQSSNQAGTTYDPGTLTNDTIYYWRIDEKNAFGTTTGEVWSFKTWIEPNLVRWWKLDEGTGNTAVDLASGQDGTIYGATWTDGLLSFDGSDDYVAIPSYTVNTNNGTISLWFETSADYSANYGGMGYLISRDSQWYSYLTVAGNGTGPYWVIGETDSQDDYYVAKEGAAPVGRWNHLVVSFDEKEATTYLNGAFVQTRPVTNSFLTLTRIGGRSQEFFNGEIDDVRIYDKALSGPEVEQLYQQDYRHPIAYWKLDESGSETIAHDSVGNDNGNVYGATWTTGKIDGALEFDGSYDYVMVGDKDNLEPQEFTLSFWAKNDNPSYYAGGGAGKGYIFGSPSEYSYRLDFGDGYAWTAITTNTNYFGFRGPTVDTEWHMWTMTVGDGMLSLYKDGAYAGSVGYTGDIDYDKSNNNFVIGARDNGWYAFDGLIDDVRFYDRVLSAGGIEQLYNQIGMIIMMGQQEESEPIYPEKASNPNPVNEATGVSIGPELSWTAGELAETHDVYLGTDYDDVNDANVSSAEYKGNYDVNTFDPGTLSFGTTYYWRIDEKNAAGVTTGDVWSFTTRTGPAPSIRWQLDEISGTIAHDYIAGKNGTFNSSDPCWTDGLIGGAVDFDGVSDYFSVPSLNEAYTGGSTFTVAGWFKTDQSTGKQTIVGQWSQAWEAGQEYYGWQVLVENSKVVARFGHDVDIYNITGTKTVTDGLWHHFAMVRNGTSVAVYVDGQPKGSGTANFEVYDTKFRIGDGSYTFSYPPTLQGGPFKGIIDDVMIFNRVLSAGEVEQLYEDVL